MLASRQHVPLDFPAAFAARGARPGHRGGERRIGACGGYGSSACSSVWQWRGDRVHARGPDIASGGNGNIPEYLTSSGAFQLRHSYGPFGETNIATGSIAHVPYRFSTKPADPDTGDYYYGYRWHNALTGRWNSRDPIEEAGGVNLYGFAGNNGVNGVDVLGLEVETNAEYFGSAGNSGITYTQVSRDFGRSYNVSNISPMWSRAGRIKGAGARFRSGVERGSPDGILSFTTMGESDTAQFNMDLEDVSTTMRYWKTEDQPVWDAVSEDSTAVDIGAGKCVEVLVQIFGFKDRNMLRADVKLQFEVLTLGGSGPGLSIPFPGGALEFGLDADLGGGLRWDRPANVQGDVFLSLAIAADGKTGEMVWPLTSFAGGFRVGHTQWRPVGAGGANVSRELRTMYTKRWDEVISRNGRIKTRVDYLHWKPNAGDYHSNDGHYKKND